MRAMLELPGVLEARVVKAGSGTPLANVLVSLHLRSGGRYYYGLPMGLTDAAGRVRLTADAVAAAFRADQLLFPMDYRVPLEECDPEAEVVVRGGAEFGRARDAALQNPMLDAAVREWYGRAQNARLAPLSRALPLSGGGAAAPVVLECTPLEG